MLLLPPRRCFIPWWWEREAPRHRATPCKITTRLNPEYSSLTCSSPDGYPKSLSSTISQLVATSAKPVLESNPVSIPAAIQSPNSRIEPEIQIPSKCCGTRSPCYQSGAVSAVLFHPLTPRRRSPPRATAGGTTSQAPRPNRNHQPRRRLRPRRPQQRRRRRSASTRSRSTTPAAWSRRTQRTLPERSREPESSAAAPPPDLESN